MNQTLRLTTRLALGVTLALTLAACGRKGAPPQRPPASVKTVAAVQMPAPVILRAFGNTQDRLSVDVVPQVSGTLVKALIRDGATVTNGQPLFLIDPRDYAARVQQAEAAVAADQANLDLARSTLERSQALAAKKLIAAQDFDTLKAKADGAAAQLQADEALREQARLNLARCTIAAPLAGICSKRWVDDGNLVVAGQTRLTNIRSYDPITVEFSVSEEDLGQVRRALAQGPVRIEVLPRDGTNSYPGVLAFVDNAVNPMNGTVLLRGEVPNPDLKLWSEQFVEVGLELGVVPDAVMVPEGAVQYGKQGTYLFVVSKENKAEMRPIKTGVRYQGLIQMVEGLAAGENVVVLGQLMLYPGATVMDTAHPPQGAGAGGSPTAPAGSHGGK